eukprot:m.412674 g.412674  ORF g.412674 m.412674 type:complete len:779 (-) comp56568_c0_seq5:1503-3839(-)
MWSDDGDASALMICLDPKLLASIPDAAFQVPVQARRDEQSLEQKARATALFAQRNFAHAAAAFTAAMLSSDEMSEVYSVCVANRALCNLHASNLLMAQSDISYARFLDRYPTATKYKVALYAGKIAQQLAQHADALLYFDEAISLLQTSRESTAQRETIGAEIQALILISTRSQSTLASASIGSTQLAASSATRPSAIVDPRALDKCTLTPGIEPNSSAIAGRGLFTTIPQPNSAHILTEQPFAWLANQTAGSDGLCDFCLGKAENAIPCSQCPMIYCSLKCRMAARVTYHWMECGLPIFHQQPHPDVSQLALRVLARVLSDALRRVSSPVATESVRDATSAQFPAAEIPLRRFLDFLHTFERPPPQLDQSHHFPHHLQLFNELCEQHSSEDALSTQPSTVLMDSVVLGVALSRHCGSLSGAPGRLWGHRLEAQQEILRTVPNLAWLSQIFEATGDGFNTSNLAMALHKISLKIRANAFAIKSLTTSPREASRIQEIKDRHLGQGLYLMGSHVNHACNPNSIASFQQTTLTISTTRDIPRAAEISISYGPLSSRVASARLRGEWLAEKFGFACLCPDCVTDKAKPSQDAPPQMLRELESGQNDVLCSCQGVYSVRSSTAGIFICSKCGQPPSVAVLESLSGQFARARSQFESAETATKDALSLYLQAAASFETFLGPCSLELGRVHDRIAQCQAETGAFDHAVRHLKKSLFAVLAKFGEHSIEAANETIKLAHLCLRASNMKEAQESTRLAIARAERFPSLRADADELKSISSQFLSP